MKRYTQLFATTLLAASLIACGGGSGSGAGSTTIPPGGNDGGTPSDGGGTPSPDTGNGGGNPSDGDTGGGSNSGPDTPVTDNPFVTPYSFRNYITVDEGTLDVGLVDIEEMADGTLILFYEQVQADGSLGLMMATVKNRTVTDRRLVAPNQRRAPIIRFTTADYLTFRQGDTVHLMTDTGILKYDHANASVIQASYPTTSNATTPFWDVSNTSQNSSRAVASDSGLYLSHECNVYRYDFATSNYSIVYSCGPSTANPNRTLGGLLKANDGSGRVFTRINESGRSLLSDLNTGLETNLPVGIGGSISSWALVGSKIMTPLRQQTGWVLQSVDLVAGTVTLLGAIDIDDERNANTLTYLRRDSKNVWLFNEPGDISFGLIEVTDDGVVKIVSQYYREPLNANLSRDVKIAWYPDQQVYLATGSYIDIPSLVTISPETNQIEGQATLIDRFARATDIDAIFTKGGELVIFQSDADVEGTTSDFSTSNIRSAHLIFAEPN